jgi:hypothetical protein
MSNTDLETWKNATLGRVVLKKYNQRGELSDEMVGGGRVFHISPKERRINQEMAANSDLDMFKNGQLTPVRLIDTEEDAKELASNPNAMSETEMHELFKGNWKTFDARVQQVSNAVTLQRMLQVASEMDATLRQVEVVKARLEEIAPSEITEITPAGSVDERTGLRPVTPR